MSAPFVRGALTIAAVAMMVGVFIGLMGWDIPTANRDAIMILIGALVARSEKIDGFFFGSSQSSHQKDDLIATMAGQTDQASGKPDDPVNVATAPKTEDL